MRTINHSVCNHVQAANEKVEKSFLHHLLLQSNDSVQNNLGLMDVSATVSLLHLGLNL